MEKASDKLKNARKYLDSIEATDQGRKRFQAQIDPVSIEKVDKDATSQRANIISTITDNVTSDTRRIFSANTTRSFEDNELMVGGNAADFVKGLHTAVDGKNGDGRATHILFEKDGKKYAYGLFDGKSQPKLKSFETKDGDEDYKYIKKGLQAGTGTVVILNETYSIQGTDWKALSDSDAGDDLPESMKNPISLIVMVDGPKTTDADSYQKSDFVH